MSDYKETLYSNLFGILGELTEYDTAEVIFDRIVDDFASSVEYHSTQSDVFTEMLNTFRHNNPMETIPEDVDEEMDFSVTANPPRPEELYGGISDINKTYLLEDRDNLLDFIKKVNFPSDLNS